MQKVLLGCLLLVLALSMAADSRAGSAFRTELELTWDDGVCSPHDCYGSPWTLAVMFQAPEWARYLTAIRFYMAEPHNPTETQAFYLYVWEPAAGSPTVPGEYAFPGFYIFGGYETNAWLEVPMSLVIDDPEQFPDRVFFVGLTIMTRFSPCIGLDRSDPVNQMSWQSYGSDWTTLADYDLMIRAVVADSLSTPVEGQTWSVVKALYR